MIKIYQIPIEKMRELSDKDAKLLLDLALGTHKVTKDEIDKNYQVIWKCDAGTENLEKIFCMFNMEYPEGYMGRSLSCGDVVETSNGMYACMTAGWEPVAK